MARGSVSGAPEDLDVPAAGLGLGIAGQPLEGGVDVDDRLVDVGRGR